MKLLSLQRHCLNISTLSFSTNSVDKCLNLPLCKTNPFLSLLSSSTSIASLKSIHTQLFLHGLSRDLPSQTKLLTLYSSLGSIQYARLVFGKIPHLDVFSYNAMIRCCFASGLYDEAISVYKQIRQRFVVHDNVVLSMALKTCSKLSEFDEGKRIHGDIVKVGEPDCFVMNVLIDMYAKCREMESVRKVFDECRERNVVSWTSIISGYIQNDQPSEGIILFNEMRREGIEPSEYTMGSLLTGCTMLDALHQGKWIHGCIVKTGIWMNPYIGTALIDIYMKCGDVADARLIFDELCNVDLVSWTAMVVGYTQRGRPVEALKVFSDKNWVCLVPNSVTLASALSASAQLSDLNLGRSIHALALKLRFEEYDVIRNALVDMYAKCCEMLEAYSIFETILQKNVVSWNIMIAGYSQNNCGYEALLLFHQMRLVGCLPDAVTVVSALSAGARLGALQVCSSLQAYAMKRAFLSNIYVSTALINFYNKCGDANSARIVFDEMTEKNTVTWCAMMGGYGVQGDSVESIALFGEMLKENLQPNHVAFTNLLSACSHTGKITKGLKYFDSMIQIYGISPSMKHYACMVDMLARAGQIEEAFDFIERMPVQAEVSVWGAFLHGCRLHSRLDFGEFAVRRMMELHPETADYYVLISNFYALEGRWVEADKFRALPKERRLMKLPGYSSVTVEL